MLLYERNGRPGAEINTQYVRIKETRNRKGAQNKKKRDWGERREKRKGGGAYVALLTRNTDEAPQ